MNRDESNLDFYNEFQQAFRAVDPQIYVPSHAYDPETEIRLGELHDGYQRLYSLARKYEGDVKVVADRIEALFTAHLKDVAQHGEGQVPDYIVQAYVAGIQKLMEDVHQSAIRYRITKNVLDGSIVHDFVSVDKMREHPVVGVREGFIAIMRKDNERGDLNSPIDKIMEIVSKCPCCGKDKVSTLEIHLSEAMLQRSGRKNIVVQEHTTSTDSRQPE